MGFYTLLWTFDTGHVEIDELGIQSLPSFGIHPADEPVQLIVGSAIPFLHLICW